MSRCQWPSLVLGVDDPLAQHVVQAVRQRQCRYRDAGPQALLNIQGLEFTADTGDVVDFKLLAQDSEQAAMDNAQASRAWTELKQVQAARRRLDEGTYGLCAHCGKAIDFRRLEALPAAESCAACQRKEEQSLRPARI
jgi:RNA polymerase-binding transcription factor DksA